MKDAKTLSIHTLEQGTVAQLKNSLVVYPYCGVVGGRTCITQRSSLGATIRNWFPVTRQGIADRKRKKKVQPTVDLPPRAKHMQSETIKRPCDKVKSWTYTNKNAPTAELDVGRQAMPCAKKQAGEHKEAEQAK